MSRRERPAKAALSRAAIVKVALAILKKEGLGKVTMRRIATALETGPASLYVYVKDTKDLHAQILDGLLAHVPTPKPGPRWRTDLGKVTEACLAVLMRYPEIARLSMTTHSTGPSSMRLLDTMAGLLLAGGAELKSAAWGVDLLLAYAVSTAVEHAGRSRSELHDLRETFAALDTSMYPHLAELGDEVVSGAGLERFRWGLETLVNGIVAGRHAKMRRGSA